MTCAVAEAVMNGGECDDFIAAMKKYGRMYPDAAIIGSITEAAYGIPDWIKDKAYS